MRFRILFLLLVTGVAVYCKHINTLKPNAVAFVATPLPSRFVSSPNVHARRLSCPRINTKRCYATGDTHVIPTDSSHLNAAATLERLAIETWREHGDTLILAVIYGIRVLRFFIMLRNLLEWLPQVNPYLPPFDTVYQLTDSYLGLFRALVPPISGVEISGAIAMHVLQQVESLLAHRPNVAQEAL